MRKIRIIAVMAMLCICFAGCSMFKSAGRTLFVEPLTFPTNKDSHRTQCRDRQWAEAAWQAEMAANPGLCSSGEYKRGFADGFADYLYAGGTGEPPPVPPRRLWNLDYRTAEGHAAVENWFAGFRRGAHAVRDAGYRDLVTAKSSLLTCSNLDAPVMPSGMPEEWEPTETIPTPQPFESIPEPRSPASPSHEPSPNTKNLTPDGDEGEPQIRMPGDTSREASEAEPRSLAIPVGDAEPLMQMPELRALKPGIAVQRKTSTLPPTGDKEHEMVVVLPPCPEVVSPETRSASSHPERSEGIHTRLAELLQCAHDDSTEDRLSAAPKCREDVSRPR